MRFSLVGLLCVVVASGQNPADTVNPFPRTEITDNKDKTLDNTDLVLAFVIFRHGDRTPDQEELDLYPHEDSSNMFYPYGPKALTNKGKQRGYLVGEYLRRRYGGLISRIYLPDEINIRTTDYDRTKMTALTALAALYPPQQSQRWNPTLNWQPIPYDTVPYDDDDLLYWYNCPRYLWLRNQIYDLPEIKKKLKPYKELYQYLSERTKTPINKPEDVFYLDNLFQALRNVGQKLPKWAVEIYPKIKEMTVIEFEIEFYNSELIQLASGVLMNEIHNITSQAVAGKTVLPQLQLYSAHENNVAALMAAAKVFKPHQPQYGATFSLELRRKRRTGQYGIAAVYSPDAGGSYQVLRIEGCENLLCDYETFINLTKEHTWTKKEYENQCPLIS